MARQVSTKPARSTPTNDLNDLDVSCRALLLHSMSRQVISCRRHHPTRKCFYRDWSSEFSNVCKILRTQRSPTHHLHFAKICNYVQNIAIASSSSCRVKNIIMVLSLVSLVYCCEVKFVRSLYQSMGCENKNCILLVV